MGTAHSTKGACPQNKILVPKSERPVMVTSPTLPVSGGTQTSKELFDSEMKTEELVKLIAESIIGRRKEIVTAYGKRELVYADYTASGRMLSFFEDYLLDTVYPLYANSHTESSRTGLQMTAFREEARKAIALDVGADLEEYAVVFAGTGSTGAMSKMLNVLGFALPEWANKRWNLESHVPLNERPVVFNGPFEHHSNELLWRESLAVTVSIDENKDGMPNLVQLENELKKYRRTGKDRILIGSFCAGSNVTGLVPDVRALATLLHRYGALAFFDFAGSAAHVPIDVNGTGWIGSAGDDPSMDALFMSPHKMIGGPGSSGILVARRKLFKGLDGTSCSRPTVPGGGTVTYVNQYMSSYISKEETREESGTPGILQDIRAGLAFSLKHRVTGQEIERLEAFHGGKALDAWRKKGTNILLVGSDRGAYFDLKRRTSIISFVVQAPDGCVDSGIKKKVPLSEPLFTGKPVRRMLHCNFVAEVLNDLYGIQSRSGCVCAGPYAHRLYNWKKNDDKRVENVRSKILSGMEVFKPGWCRVNFNFFITDAERDFIIAAVLQVAQRGWQLLPYYHVDRNGHWIHTKNRSPSRSKTMKHLNQFGVKKRSIPRVSFSPKPIAQPLRTKEDFDMILNMATMQYNKALRLAQRDDGMQVMDFYGKFVSEDALNDVWWMLPSDAVHVMQTMKKKPGADPGEAKSI